MSNANSPVVGITYESAKNGEIIVREGMTKREYFAAHAPEMPEWFKCEDKVKVGKLPEINPRLLQARFGTQMNFEKWRQNPSITKQEEGRIQNDEIAKWESDYMAWWNHKESAPMINAAHKLRAWRYYYADMMLAEEPETPKQEK